MRTSRKDIDANGRPFNKPKPNIRQENENEKRKNRDADGKHFNKPKPDIRYIGE